MQISQIYVFFISSILLGMVPAANAANEIGSTTVHVQANIISETCTRVISADDEINVDFGDIQIQKVKDALQTKTFIIPSEEKLRLSFTCSSGSKAYFSIDNTGNSFCQVTAIAQPYPCNERDSLVFPIYVKWKDGNTGYDTGFWYGEMNQHRSNILQLDETSTGTVILSVGVGSNLTENDAIPGAVSMGYIIKVWEQ